jgi:hypothetical protein
MDPWAHNRQVLVLVTDQELMDLSRLTLEDMSHQEPEMWIKDKRLKCTVESYPMPSSISIRRRQVTIPETQASTPMEVSNLVCQDIIKLTNLDKEKHLAPTRALLTLTTSRWWDKL